MVSKSDSGQTSAIMESTPTQQNSQNSTATFSQLQEHTPGLPNFIVIFFVLTVALALVSASFKFLGWSGLWRAPGRKDKVGGGLGGAVEKLV